MSSLLSVKRHRRLITPSSVALIDPMSVPALAFMWAEDPLWTPPAPNAGVPSWRNSGSVTGDPAQATALLQPLYRVSGINGHPVVEGDGTTQYLDVDIADIASPYQILLVAKLLTIASTRSIIGRGGTGASDGFGTSASSNWIMRGAGMSIIGDAADTNAHVFHITVNGASSSIIKDEVQIVAGSITTSMLRLDLFAGTLAGVPGAYSNSQIALYGIFSSATNLAPLRLSLAKRYSIL